MMPKRFEILRQVENGSKTPILLPESPVQVWTLLNEEKFNEVGLVHHFSGFIEDSMHDWHWINGKFFFHGHSSGRGDKQDLVIIYEK
jgi:hypothetical protein